MTLGEYINQYLIEHDMSMRKFASLANVSHAYISNIVNGKTSRGNSPSPTIVIYRQIASAMGMDANTLLSMIDDQVAWGDKNKTVTHGDGKYGTIIDLSKLSEDQRKAIEDVLNASPEILSVARPAIELILSPKQVQDAQQ